MDLLTTRYSENLTGVLMAKTGLSLAPVGHKATQLGVMHLITIK